MTSLQDAQSQPEDVAYGHLDCTPSEPEPPTQSRPIIGWLFRHRWRIYAAGLGLVSCALTATAWAVCRRRRRCKERARSHDCLDSESGDGKRQVRIPLKEVVRFKERQWFLEELEASRAGDSNAMLRLAKMYLHGQGCTPNLGMAQEWLRKARHQGMYATLDELWAGEPQELERLKLESVRRVERRRAAQHASAQSLVSSGKP